MLLGQLLVLAITTGKTKSSSRLSAGLCCCKHRREIFILAGCAVVVLAITTGKKKVPVVCLAGTQSITTGKKKIQAGLY